ncbi:hypothetical protein [Alistipes timonensis]|uniref:hypothetical protein n=1 Tax=Alistipes timonensis TaxID=1465754 RepID=UPI0026701895|nr:hypothetical protein [Alistipes timonensis]
MWSGASQLNVIFCCRRRDGVAEAARNAMKRSEANKVATNPHGKKASQIKHLPLSNRHTPLPDNNFRILANQFRIFLYLCEDEIGEPILKIGANFRRNDRNKLKFNHLI